MLGLGLAERRLKLPIRDHEVPVGGPSLRKLHGRGGVPQRPGQGEAVKQAQAPVARGDGVAGEDAVGLQEEEGEEQRAAAGLLEDPVAPEGSRRGHGARGGGQGQVRRRVLRVDVKVDVLQQSHAGVLEGRVGAFCRGPRANVAVEDAYDLVKE